MDAEIVYYIVIPLVVAIIPIIFAWVKRDEVTAVRHYLLEELKDDVKDLKDRVRTLELLSPGSLIGENQHVTHLFGKTQQDHPT